MYASIAIAGSVDDLPPRVLLPDASEIPRTLIAGKPGLLRVARSVPGADDALDLFAWPGDSAALRISAASRRSASVAGFFFAGDALFWNKEPGSENPAAPNEAMVYTQRDGARTLLTFGDDVSRGVGAIATDGKDIVWFEGSGRDDPTKAFPVTTLMTSPFATDGAALRPRRLRSAHSYSFGIGDSTVVGCGFVAYPAQLKERGVGTLVVRLADGVAWFLPYDAVGSSTTWKWARALALTCTELFATVEVGDESSHEIAIVRARFDSLGPSIPPD
jgi:hypothetical protein